MSNICGRASSEKVSHAFNEESKTTDKKCCSVKKVTADSKHLNHFSKRDGHHKVKRLKTRKERSQMRGGWKETSKTKSYLHCCNHQSRRDMAHFQNYCHNSRHRTLRKNAPISSSAPALQESSIITDSRLIGHHGLFNHEVKSSDIERLLSKPSRHEQIGQHVEEKSSDVLYPSSTSHIPALLSTEGLQDAGDVLPFKKKVHPAAKSHNDDQETEVNNNTFNNQGSNITSGQKQEQQLDLSSGNYKSNLSCKYSPVKTAENNNSVPSEKDHESQLSPLAGTDNVKTLSSQVRKNMISDLGQRYKNRDHNTQTGGYNPNPLSLSSSPTADGCNTQQDPECVSKSISTLATQLCECLHLPLLKRRNLLSESRKVLLKSLQERHGSSLQANLHEVQQSVRFGMHPTLANQEKESRMMEEEEILSSDTATRMDTSDFFNWKSSSQPHQNLQQTAEWLANPVDTSGSQMYEPLISFSPRFSMDFEQAESSATGLFAHSPISYQGKKASASDNWEDPFCQSKREESFPFDPFKDNFMSHPGEVRESSYTSQYHCRNIQPFFPFQAHPSDGHSVKPMHFIQEQDPFGTDRYSIAPSFPACIDHPPQRNHFQPFSQTSTSTFFTTSYADMLQYPPSHMLESRPTPPRSSLLSPDHWSFPPMRLY